MLKMTIEEKIREAFLEFQRNMQVSDHHFYAFKAGYLALLNSLGRIGVVGGGDDLYFLPKGVTRD